MSQVIIQELVALNKVIKKFNRQNRKMKKIVVAINRQFVIKTSFFLLATRMIAVFWKKIQGILTSLLTKVSSFAASFKAAAAIPIIAKTVGTVTVMTIVATTGTFIIQNGFKKNTALPTDVAIAAEHKSVVEAKKEQVRKTFEKKNIHPRISPSYTKINKPVVFITLINTTKIKSKIIWNANEMMGIKLPTGKDIIIRWKDIWQIQHVTE